MLKTLLELMSSEWLTSYTGSTFAWFKRLTGSDYASYSNENLSYLEARRFYLNLNIYWTSLTVRYCNLLSLSLVLLYYRGFEILM